LAELTFDSVLGAGTGVSLAGCGSGSGSGAAVDGLGVGTVGTVFLGEEVWVLFGVVLETGEKDWEAST
jgi:hypothetical protein